MMYEKSYIQQLLRTGADITYHGGEFYLNSNYINPQFFPDFWDTLCFSLFDHHAVWTFEGGVRCLNELH